MAPQAKLRQGMDLARTGKYYNGVLVRSGRFRLERPRPLSARQRLTSSRFACSFHSMPDTSQPTNTAVEGINRQEEAVIRGQPRETGSTWRGGLKKRPATPTTPRVAAQTALTAQSGRFTGPMAFAILRRSKSHNFIPGRVGRAYLNEGHNVRPFQMGHY